MTPPTTVFGLPLLKPPYGRVTAIDLKTGELKGGGVVAVDAVGAGVGEVVLYASGSSARQTTVTKDRPVDATIMAIVDTLEVGGLVIYQK